MQGGMNLRGFSGGGRGALGVRGRGGIYVPRGQQPVPAWQPIPGTDPGGSADLTHLQRIRCPKKDCTFSCHFTGETDWRNHKNACRVSNPVFRCSFSACENSTMTFESLEAAAQHENNVHRLWVCTAHGCELAFLIHRYAVGHVLMDHEHILEPAAATAVRQTWTPIIPPMEGKRIQLDRRLRFDLGHLLDEDERLETGLVSVIGTSRRSSRVQTVYSEGGDGGRLQESILRNMCTQLDSVNNLLLDQNLSLGPEGSKVLGEKLQVVKTTLEQRNPEISEQGESITWRLSVFDNKNREASPLQAPTSSAAAMTNPSSLASGASRRPSHSSAGDLADPAIAPHSTKIDVRNSQQPFVNVNFSDTQHAHHSHHNAPGSPASNSTSSEDHNDFLERPPVIVDDSQEPKQALHLDPADQHKYFEEMQGLCVEAAFNFYQRHKTHLDTVTDRRGRALCITNKSQPITSPQDLSLPQWTHLLRRLSDAKGLTRDMVSRIESFNGEIQPVDEVRHAYTKEKVKSDRDLLALVQMTRIFTWQLKDWQRCGYLDELYTILELKIKDIKKELRRGGAWETAVSRSKRSKALHRSAVSSVKTWPRHASEADREE